MNRRTPGSTRTVTLFPDTTLVRSRIPLGVDRRMRASLHLQERLQPRALALVAGRPGNKGSRLKPLLQAIRRGRRGCCLHPREHRLGHARAARAEERERLRSEEHTSELQSLMRIPDAVFCLKKKNNN